MRCRWFDNNTSTWLGVNSKHNVINIIKLLFQSSVLTLFLIPKLLSVETFEQSVATIRIVSRICLDSERTRNVFSFTMACAMIYSVET